MSTSREFSKQTQFDFGYNHIHDKNLSETQQEDQVEQVVEFLKEIGIYNGHIYDDGQVEFGFINQEQNQIFQTKAAEKFGVQFFSEHRQTFEGYSREDQNMFNSLAKTYLEQMGITNYKISDTDGETIFKFENKNDRNAFSQLVTTGIFEETMEQLNQSKSLMQRMVHGAVQAIVEKTNDYLLN